jgi:3-hydroxybutyryl-CoA dehydrogenase
VNLDKVGVVGAGTIGRGVAQAFAQNGISVVLLDVDEGQLDRALRQIDLDVRAHRLLGGRGTDVDAGTVLARIEPGTDVAALGDVDFVVENVTENSAVKRAVYREIDQVVRRDVIFAVNTSAVPITRVAGWTGRPAEVLGLHFMNPVPLIDAVEVVRGEFTSDRTLDVSLDLLKSIGKDGIVVGDYPGFVTNRVLMLTINEAIFCVQDQVASPADVDRIFRGCFAHRMGPLETGDLIGLDTILNSITVMYESYKDSKYRPAPLLQHMVDAGLLGRKTGKGFYTYA